jgi:hypothetical protein
MKATIGMALAGCLVAAVAVASDAHTGTWKLNEAKSKISPGAPKNQTVVYADVGDDVKVTVDGVDASGKPLHNEWTGKFDGKDHPVTGDPDADARSYTKVDDRTLTFAQKKGGKTMATGRIVIAPDGKSRTVMITGTNAKGEKISTNTVYDKQ